MPPRRKAAPRESKAKSTCKLSCCSVSDELKASIRASAEAGRGKSMFDGGDDSTDLDRFHGAMCRCGVPRKPPGLAKHMNDDGRCAVHPDAPPQRWTRGAEGQGDV